MTNKDDSEGATYNRILSMDGFFRFMDTYSLKSQVTRTLTKDSASSFEATGYNLNLERLGTNSYNSIWYNDFPEEFQAQSGYMSNVVGYREVGTYNNLSFRKPHELINEFELNGSGSGRFDYDNELREEYFSAAAEMSLDRVWTKLGFRKNHEYVDGKDFRYSDFRYELWNTPRRYLEHYFSLMWGDAAHYTEGFTGWRYRLIYNATLKPVSRAVFNVNISSEDFYYKYRGSRCYLQTILWTKLSYQIVPDMLVRGIYQYNNLFKISQTSLLFAFEYRPLSNIYVGTNLYDFSRAEQMDDNLEAFVKLGYLWRL